MSDTPDRDPDAAPPTPPATPDAAAAPDAADAPTADVPAAAAAPAAPPGPAATPPAGPPQAYPPYAYPPPPRRSFAWRQAWIPGLVGLVLGGAIGAGVTALAVDHGRGDGRFHMHHYGPPGDRFGYRPGPGYMPQPGFPRYAPPGVPAPAPSSTG